MLADGNGVASSNGTGRAPSFSNGSHTAAAAQRPGSAAGGENGSAGVSGDGTTSNGTHKSSSAPGGSSLNGSSTVQNGKQAQRPGQQQQRSVVGGVYFGHDRGEVTRILIQALSEMGYHSAAESVSSDSGFELESPTVAAFRSAVLEGAWDEAEQLLFGAVTAAATDRGRHQPGSGLVLAPGADRNVMRFWLRQQKFLELLELRDTARALMVLRTELQPLYQDTQKLHFLSGLLMCQSTDDLKAKANWDGAYGHSRNILLSQLSKCISPSVMLPEHRLAVLLQQVKDSQIGMCLYHTTPDSPSLYSDHKCERINFPSEVMVELEKHNGEVWHVAFSHDGRRLATAGGNGDKQVIIWDVRTFEILHVLKDHDKGIGKVSWSPDDSKLVSCSLDRYARIWDTSTGKLLKTLEKFEEPVSSCVWAADSRSFVTGTLDAKKSICHWDLSGRLLSNWNKKHRVEDLSISPDRQWLVAMDDQHHIHVYNFHTHELDYELELKSRPCSINISLDSRHLLVNKVDGEAQLIDLLTREAVQKYTGHTGGECIIRGGFGGANESFVVSGSEDGYISIWHKMTGVAVERLEAHQPRCNTITWNPADPCMLASCGDDGKVKIWSNKECIRNFKTMHLIASNGWRTESQLD